MAIRAPDGANNSLVAGLEEVGQSEDSSSMASSLLHPELWY